MQHDRKVAQIIEVAKSHGHNAHPHDNSLCASVWIEDSEGNEHEFVCCNWSQLYEALGY